MAVAQLNTNKSWTRLLAELDEVMRKWRKEYLPPVCRTSKERRLLTVRWIPKAAWKESACGKFPTPEQNIHALISSFDALRLADQRGILGVFAEAAQHFALPSGQRTPFEILGVAPTASVEEVRTAWRRKVQETTRIRVDLRQRSTRSWRQAASS